MNDFFILSRYQIDINMKEKIWFSEQQKIRQVWKWVLLLIAIGIPIVLILKDVIQQVMHGIPAGDDPVENSELLIVFGIVTGLLFILVILFARVKLDTTITEKEIGVRYYPFRKSFRFFRWEDVETAEVKSYQPFLRGGWGMRKKWSWGLSSGISDLRLGIFNKKNILYIAGGYVLQLKFKDGTVLILGTQKKNELELALMKIKQIQKENQFK